MFPEAAGSFCLWQYGGLRQKSSTTRSLGELAYWYRFRDHILDQPDALMEYQTFDYAYKTYRVGLVASRSAVLSEAGIPRHNLFLIMGTGSALMFLVALFLGTVVTLNHTRKDLRGIQQENVAKNKQIQSLLEIAARAREEAVPEEEEDERCMVYDAEMIRNFLRKSDDPKLYPLASWVFASSWAQILQQG